MTAPKSDTGLLRAATWLGVTTLVLVALLGMILPSQDWLVVFLVLHGLIVVGLLMTVRGPLAVLLIAGFLLRVLFMWMDLGTGLEVFGSGQDTENFYRIALQIYHDPAALSEDLYGGIFPKLCGMLFWLVGPSREIVQYLNVLLGVCSMVLVALACDVLGTTSRSRNIVVGILALMPIAASVSAIFLRESLITFLVSVSVYWFCVWLRSGAIMLAVGTLAAVSLAGVFHLGVFGLLVGYIVAFLVYDRRSGRLVLSVRRVITMVPVIGAFLFVVFRFPELFLEKFEGVSTATDIIVAATGSAGASAYLPEAEIESPIDFLLFGGVKALFLLISPVPWQWRGFSDAVTFALDGALFAAAIFLVIRGLFRTQRSRLRSVLVLLVIGLVGASLIIGAGTANSGTAMRHREKLTPLIAVAVAVALSSRSRDEASEHEARDDGSLVIDAKLGEAGNRRIVSVPGRNSVE